MTAAAARRRFAALFGFMVAVVFVLLGFSFPHWQWFGTSAHPAAVSALDDGLSRLNASLAVLPAEVSALDDGLSRLNEALLAARSQALSFVDDLRGGAGAGLSASRLRGSGAAVAALSSVPRLIWQTYRTLPLPPKPAEISGSWALKNPGWEHRLVDDEGARAVLETHFPSDRVRFGNLSLLEAYDAFPLGVMRADTWRYAVLFALGGVYADVDASCVMPISDWLPSAVSRRCGLVIGLENDAHLCNWVIMSKPGHHVLRTVLELIIERSAPSYKLSSVENMVHERTGPALFTAAVAKAIGCEEEAKGPHASRRIYDGLLAGTCGRAAEDVCILPAAHVNKIYVVNHYGSQKENQPGWEGCEELEGVLRISWSLFRIRERRIKKKMSPHLRSHCRFMILFVGI